MEVSDPPLLASTWPRCPIFCPSSFEFPQFVSRLHKCHMTPAKAIKLAGGQLNMCEQKTRDLFSALNANFADERKSSATNGSLIRPLKHLVGVPLSQHLKKCLDYDLDIEPEAPIIDVPKIKLHALGNMFDRWRLTPCAVALGPTGNTGLDVVSKGIIAQNIFEIAVVSQRVRTRPNQGHIAFQHI